MARVINIASAKGGVGKTTTAINLGIALSKYFNKRVALIDCNLTTAHIGLYLGMYSTPVTLNSVLRGESSLAGAIYIHPSGIRIVPASLNLQDLQGMDDSILVNKIKDSLENFDIILLDSAPGVGKEAMIALKACDEVLFVANPFIPSAVDVGKIANLCSVINNQESKKIKTIGVVLNRTKEKDYELSKEEMEKLTSLHLIGTVPEDEEVLQGVNSRIPTILSNPNSPSSKAFIKLAASIVGEKYVERTEQVKTLQKEEPIKEEIEAKVEPQITITEPGKKRVHKGSPLKKRATKSSLWNKVMGLFFRQKR